MAFFGLGYALTSIGESGAWVFSALMVCLGLLGLVVVPLGAFSALRSERVDQTLDLITQTTLTPRGIVIGKLMTQWVKLVTLFAGLAPFIAMSFLLGGIDLLTILISLRGPVHVVDVGVRRMSVSVFGLPASGHVRV